MDYNFHQRFHELTTQQQIQAVDRYLKRLGQSIKVNYISPKYTTSWHDLVTQFVHSSGYNKSRDNLGWVARQSNWYDKRPETGCFHANHRGEWEYKVNNVQKRHYENVLAVPVFGQWFDESLKKAKKSNNYDSDKYSVYNSDLKNPTIRPEGKQMNRTIDNVLESNKDAAKIAGKLTVGKTANTLILEKLYKHLPWYAKLFGKRKTAINNGVSKLVAANVAAVLSQHFAGRNTKLTYVTEAMIQDAMVDFTRDSKIVDSLLEELTELVDLPDLGKLSDSNK